MITRASIQLKSLDRSIGNMAITGLTASHVVYDEIWDPKKEPLDTIFGTHLYHGAGISSTPPSGSPAVGVWSGSRYTTDYRVQGNAIYAEAIYSEILFEDIGKERVKFEMCTQLVRELLKCDSIEFTMEPEPHTGNIKVRARIFATKNSDIQLLRINDIIK